MIMTQIRSVGTTPRRAGELGVHSLDQFLFSVPDLRRAEEFYTCFGLKLANSGNGFDIYTEKHSHRWGTIVEGPTKQLGHISFAAYEEDFPRFRLRLEKIGIKRLDPPSGFESNGLWFRDPDGVLIEIRVAEKTSPNVKSIVDNSSAPAGVQAAPFRQDAQRVSPRRLAHVLTFTSDVGKAIEFYSRVIGLRLSDRSGDGIAFMHGIHGSDHHMIAFAKAKGPGLHHLSWDVGSTHEVGLGAKQMADKGFAAGWGVGRHVLGSNFFHYVRDPWGSYSEYSSDIDYIAVDQNWEAADHPADESFYIWGPTPPEDFAVNYELVE
jgi:catechol 2,3-dioxygenase